MKKSFLLMCDLLDSVELMTDNEAGLLFKAIIAHINNKQIELPRHIQFAFIPIINQIDRDAEKYSVKCQRLRENASKGGKASAKSKQLLANASESKQIERDTDTDTDNETDTEKIKQVAKKVEYPDWLDSQAWLDWKQHRQEIRKPMTPLAETKAINKLQGMLNGVSQRQIIDHSIANGYQGLYAPKRSSQQTNASRFKENLINA